jgi:hypothetical protein
VQFCWQSRRGRRYHRDITGARLAGKARLGRPVRYGGCSIGGICAFQRTHRNHAALEELNASSISSNWACAATPSSTSSFCVADFSVWRCQRSILNPHATSQLGRASACASCALPAGLETPRTIPTSPAWSIGLFAVWVGRSSHFLIIFSRKTSADSFSIRGTFSFVEAAKGRIERYTFCRAMGGRHFDFILIIPVHPDTTRPRNTAAHLHHNRKRVI